MDSNEARKILALYRPGSPDAADPRVLDALEQLRRDPALASWFEQQSAAQAALRAKFKAIPVPAGLKRDIILGQQEHQRIIPLPAVVKILAAAAAIAVLVAVGWFSFRKPVNQYVFNNYRDRVARQVQRGASYMDILTNSQADILSFCQKKGGPADFTLPQKLQQMPGIGGSVFSWNNQKVSMLCLNAGTASAPNNVWVFVMDKGQLPDPPPAQAQYLLVSKLMTASWTSGNRVFVLAGAGTEKDLQTLIED